MSAHLRRSDIQPVIPAALNKCLPDLGPIRPHTTLLAKATTDPHTGRPGSPLNFTLPGPSLLLGHLCIPPARLS